MANGYPQAPAMPTAPAVPVALIDQYTRGTEHVEYIPTRLKTNEEWVAEASAAADAAAELVLRRTTVQRLKALSDNIIGDYERNVEVRQELVEEFANLVG